MHDSFNGQQSVWRDLNSTCGRLVQWKGMIGAFTTYLILLVDYICDSVLGSSLWFIFSTVEYYHLNNEKWWGIAVHKFKVLNNSSTYLLSFLKDQQNFLRLVWPCTSDMMWKHSKLFCHTLFYVWTSYSCNHNIAWLCNRKVTRNRPWNM